MKYDPNNEVVKLCAEGIRCEGEGKKVEAFRLFLSAWDLANDDVERFTAAHYVARHQESVSDKLEWDIKALHYALKFKDESVKSVYPSLYLNIAKGYEDLEDYLNANNHYRLALSFTNHLIEDGYGTMLKRGIDDGLKRISRSVSND